MAKAIKGRQHSLMKQIIQLALLMDLSIASLNKAIAGIQENPEALSGNNQE